MKKKEMCSTMYITEGPVERCETETKNGEDERLIDPGHVYTYVISILRFADTIKYEHLKIEIELHSTTII